MNQAEEVRAIEARYRAYCDACQSKHLEKLPNFWSLPAMFAVDTGGPETEQTLLTTPAEMTKLYSTLFGPDTPVDKTVIDSSEVTFYGEKLATIKTTLRHFAGATLNDKQSAVYGCRKVDGIWIFIFHLSVDTTEDAL